MKLRVALNTQYSWKWPRSSCPTFRVLGWQLPQAHVIFLIVFAIGRSMGSNRTSSSRQTIFGHTSLPFVKLVEPLPWCLVRGETGSGKGLKKSQGWCPQVLAEPEPSFLHRSCGLEQWRKKPSDNGIYSDSEAPGEWRAEDRQPSPWESII